MIVAHFYFDMTMSVSEDINVAGVVAIYPIGYDKPSFWA